MTDTLRPLVVFGDVNLSYDFGPEHPLTPRRFAPSVDLMRTVGADRFVEPRMATDDELARLHSRHYIETVREFSNDPRRSPADGIGPGDCPPFDGMHESSAAIAGGSIDAVDRILAGEVEHAFNPGGGLHHAMAARASGFCIYNDVALAVARARDAGHRVLYVDLDVHHGDGTQALFWDDPQVLTFSIHETGMSLFPGTGFVEEGGGPAALGTKVNVPLQPLTGDGSWLAAVERMLPALAAAFKPTFLVTQHGCDTHVNDPLAHLRLTTRAYRAATTLLDRIAHEHAGGRWLATGGGGYDGYRVVPRSWSLVWLAQAHREPPAHTDEAWRGRWAAEFGAFRSIAAAGPVPRPGGHGQAAAARPRRVKCQDRGACPDRGAGAPWRRSRMTAELGFVDAPGARLYYEVEGEGSPLTLIHAGVAHLRMWDAQVEAWRDRHRVIRYDTRGFGRTLVEDVPYSNRADLGAVLDHLGVEQTHLLGLSRGSMIATDFLVENPERVSSLTWVAGGLRGFEADEDPRLTAMWPEMERLEEAKDWEPLVELETQVWTDGPGQPANRVDPALRRQMIEWNMDNYRADQPANQPIQPEVPAAQLIDRIKVPALFIWGTFDEQPVLRAGEKLTAEVAWRAQPRFRGRGAHGQPRATPGVQPAGGRLPGRGRRGRELVANDWPKRLVDPDGS